jgi:hypothetical protein
MVHFAHHSSVTAIRQLHARELERIGEEIATLAAHVHSATYQLLALLAEFDDRDGWSGSGFRSCAHWLSWRTGIAAGAAREKVRAARALRSLPHVSAAMHRGELSFAKVRAITRVATPQNEAELLEVARNGTAAQVERIVRAWRRVDRLEEEDADRARHESRHLSIHIDDDGMYVVRGRLEPEAGALLEKALEVAGEVLYGRGPSATGAPGEMPGAAERRADAAGVVAEMALAHGAAGESRGATFEVTVHVDADALREDAAEGQAVLADGARVSAETSRRLACDAGRVIMMHDAAGNTVNVGRRTRTIPPPIRRALSHRDRTCRFPGCDLRYCDAHHIVHWADGGVTSLDNLVLLCRRHHRAVHEGGFTIARDAGGSTRVYRPDGSVLPHVPDAPVLHADLVSTHAARGVAVDGSSLVTFGSGGPLDLHMAVLSLRAMTG